MPKMGGPELAEKLTAQQPSIRTLFISGYAKDVLSKNNESALKSLLIKKPFERSVLLSHVRAALDT